MIKKKSYWILMLTAICILAVTGCKKEGKTADFHIYYTDSEGVSLVEKGIKPEGKTQKEQIDEILDKIQKNTDDIDYRSPFVKEVKVKEWSVKDGKLIVDFNRNYQKLSATEEILLRAAVVCWTDFWSGCCVIHDRRRIIARYEWTGGWLYAAIGFCKKYRCESPFLSERDIFVVLW